MELFDQEILDTIFLEIGELLEKLSQDIILLKDDMNNPEFIKRIFRYAHTIKGNGGMLECEPLVMLSHRFEDILSLMRDGNLKMAAEAFPLFDEITGLLTMIFRKLKAGHEIDIDVSGVLARLITGWRTHRNSHAGPTSDWHC